ncbi:Uncharacterised protein [Mycobacteroides abscessus subsp. abscessus]|nr:Uncharacterised protein [Mycobacteroides abscessus subsp. abscessus]
MVSATAVRSRVLKTNVGTSYGHGLPCSTSCSTSHSYVVDPIARAPTSPMNSA